MKKYIWLLCIIAGLGLLWLICRDCSMPLEQIPAGPAAGGVLETTTGGASTHDPVLVDGAVAPLLPDEAPVSARGRILRRDGTKEAVEFIDGECDGLSADFNEPLYIRLHLENVRTGQPVRLEADNGGVLNQTFGTAVVMPDADSGEIGFEYVLGGHSGRYTVYITQGDRQEVLEFRVGPEPPRGEAGPPRFFNPDYVEEK